MSSYHVLAIPFHGPLDGKDLDGEYFDARTDTGLTESSASCPCYGTTARTK